MPNLAVVALAALLFEINDFFAAMLVHNFRRHRRAGDNRSPDHERRTCIQREHAIQCNLLARLDIQLFDVQNIALFHAILLAAGLNYCISIHGISPNEGTEATAIAATMSTPKPRVIRVTRKRPDSGPRRRVRWPWVRLGIMAIAGVAMLALTADFVTLRLKADKVFHTTGPSPLITDALLDVATATNRYVDFAGRFSIARPATWAVYPFKQDGDYDVTLRGPHQMEISIMTKPIASDDLAALRAALDSAEERLRIVTNIEEIEFLGHPAFRRTLPLGTITVEAIDFPAGSLHVHLSASAPRKSFDDLRPVLTAMMESLRVE